MGETKMDNDLISRSRLLKELEDTEINNRYSVAVLIHIQPAVEQPQGKWITNKEYIDKEFNGHYEGSCFNSPYNCSCCGYSPEDNRPNFCPNCGADMRGKKNDT